MGHWEWDLRSDRFTIMADEMFSLLALPLRNGRRNCRAFLATVDVANLNRSRSPLAKHLPAAKPSALQGVAVRTASCVWARTHAETKFDDHGLPERIVGITLDITAYIAAKQELTHSRQFLLAITDNMTEGMIATTRRRRHHVCERRRGTALRLRTVRPHRRKCPRTLSGSSRERTPDRRRAPIERGLEERRIAQRRVRRVDAPRRVVVARRVQRDAAAR